MNREDGWRRVRNLAQDAKLHTRETVACAALQLARRTWRSDFLSGRPHFIGLDYPPTHIAGPRYGYGQPPHEQLANILRRDSEVFERSLALIEDYGADLARIDLQPHSPADPSWLNGGWLPALDGATLYAFLRSRCPRTYVEVGSGNSTKFAARAKRDGDMSTTIVSIDPAPRAEIDALCDEVIRVPFESIDLSILTDLGAGDLVFFDGSHRVFGNSDVTAFFLDVLPALSPGVLVGVHDIYLPYDYPHNLTVRFYSEQYLLAAYILAQAEFVQPVLPVAFVREDPELRSKLDLTWATAGLGHLDPDGSVFWMSSAPS